MATEEKAEAVEVTLDAKGIPVYLDDKKKPIAGLKKEWFLNEQVKPEDKNEALKAFITYQIALKDAKIERSEAFTATLKTQREGLEVKLNNVGKELSDEEKIAAKIDALTKALETAKTAKAALLGEG